MGFDFLLVQPQAFIEMKKPHLRRYTWQAMPAFIQTWRTGRFPIIKSVTLDCRFCIATLREKRQRSEQEHCGYFIGVNKRVYWNDGFVMKWIDSQYRYLSDRQLETHQQGTSLADFSSECVFGRKAIDTFFGYVTVPSATKSAIETQGSVLLLQYSVSFLGGVFPIE